MVDIIPDATDFDGIMERLKPKTTNAIKQSLPANFTNHIDWDSEMQAAYLARLSIDASKQGVVPTGVITKDQLESEPVYTGGQHSSFVQHIDNPYAAFYAKGV